MRIALSILGISLLFLGCATTDSLIKRPTVQEVDIDRYIGKWYEIARIDNRFERELVGVTAEYSLRSDGRIDVLNAGFKKTLDGKRKVANGVARVPDESKPGRLQVTFFLWFWSDYLILELDAQNYQYALVGSSTDDYLWVLSRTPTMDDSIYQMLVDRASVLGYDTSRLMLVPQQRR